MRISDWSSDVCSSDLADGILTAGQADFLRRAVRERQNILIAGGTSTGKTTLANAFLAEIAATGDRVPIGRAHVCTPVTTAPLVCRLLLEKKQHARQRT